MSAAAAGGATIPGTRFPSESVVTVEALASLCARLKRLDAIALDTEFVRTRTFFARLGLVQISDGSTCYLVDPIAVRDLSPLAEILAAEKPVKVLYSCSEDMEVLYHSCCVVPQGVFDAQIAAGVLGYSFTGGYQALVKELLGVELPKGATRSNWCRRPLSAAQLFYAIEDVEHLLQVYEILVKKLKEQGRFEWAIEEFAALSDVSKIDPDPETYYLKLKQVASMKPRQLAALRELCAWREKQARRRDRPRNFVVKDSVLVQMARRSPRCREDFERYDSIHPREIQRSHKFWLRILHRAAAMPDEELPKDMREYRRTSNFDRLVKALRAAVVARSESLGVQSEILAPRRMLEGYAFHVLNGNNGSCSCLNGWRRKVLGDDLEAAARRELQDS